MAKLTWDESINRKYETGVSNGVLYVRDANGNYPFGVSWNGLTGVNENPSGGEPSPMYADNLKYLNLLSIEEFKATIEAYTYPDEFGVCEGAVEVQSGVQITQQKRSHFGMVYKTLIGNDIDGNDLGYKLHLVYGALAEPSEKAYKSVNENPEVITFSWELTTTPVAVTGQKPTAHMEIDSTSVDATALAALETVLFGDTGVDPRLPLPDEVLTILSTSPDAIALSSSTPTDGASDIAIADDIVLTFNNAIVQENVILMTQAGVPVAVTKTWDATNKILTVNPDSNLANSTSYIVVVDGVVDQFGQLLATETVNFTTIA